MTQEDNAKVTPKKKGGGKVARNPNWQPQFLKLFGVSLNIVASAHGAGIDRQTVYRARRNDPEFAAAMDDAREEAIERLEAQAYQRAGKMSDTLLIFLLKAHKPAIYRENVQQQVSGHVEIIVKRENRSGTTSEN